MNEVIYRGLRLVSDKCKYYQVREGNVCSLVEDTINSTLVLTFTPGSTSKSLSLILGIQSIGKDISMISMNSPKKFSQIILSLNGLKLKKLTSDTHILNLIIVSDSESRVVQDYNHTIIVVSKEDYKNEDFIKYLFYSGNLIYFQPIGNKLPENYEIRNFPKISIKDSNLNLKSESETIFSLRRRYDDYVIRAIDYQDQFILEIKKILNNYGIELVRQNKETTLKKSSYVTYQFMQTPIKYNHPKYSYPDDKIMQHKLPIEFSLRSTDMVLYFDFKNKYNNVNLLTNFCEFKTTDKYGERWTAAVKWGNITEDFNHTYQQDDNANFSYQCQFRCELYFYEVIDDKYEFLKEIIGTLEITN